MVKKLNQRAGGRTPSMFEGSHVLEVTDNDFKFKNEATEPEGNRNGNGNGNGNGNDSRSGNEGEDTNIDEIIVLKKQKPAYMMVYSSSCPHCQNKKDIYIKSAEHLMNGKKPEVLVLAVNVQDGKTRKLQEKLGISGVPSFFKTDEAGRVKRLDDALTVLSQNLNKSPEEVRQSLSDTESGDVEETDTGEFETDTGDFETDTGEFETETETGTGEFEGPREFEGPGETDTGTFDDTGETGETGEFGETGETGQVGSGHCGETDRETLKSILNRVSVKDLKSLNKEFKGSIKGRRKVDLVKHLL